MITEKKSIIIEKKGYFGFGNIEKVEEIQKNEYNIICKENKDKKKIIQAILFEKEIEPSYLKLRQNPDYVEEIELNFDKVKKDNNFYPKLDFNENG
jgi:hypothetical protein